MRFFLLSGLIAFAALPAMAAAAADNEVAEPFVASRDSSSFERSAECLTQAIYYEARNQSEEGQRAVAQVVLNRVRHPAFPNTVCGVVYQGAVRAGGGCQFTFTCDGSMNAAIQPYAWERARRLAEEALHGSVYRPVGLATNYHTTAIHPYWAPSLVPQVIVGAHIFYRRPGAGTVEAFSQAPADDDYGAPERPVHFALPRQAARSRARFADMPQVEIPVVERPILFRAAGSRATPAVASDMPRAATRQAAAAAAPRSAPRVQMQAGVRIFRGS